MKIGSCFRCYLLGSILIAAIFSLFSACFSDPKNEQKPVFVYSTPPAGIASGPLKGRIDIKTVDSETGKPVKGAAIYVYESKSQEKIAELTTDDMGIASLEDARLNQPVSITVVCSDREAYDTLSILAINASQLEIPLVLRKEPPEKKFSMHFPEFTKEEYRLLVYANNELKMNEAIRSKKGKSIAIPDPFVIKIRVKDTFILAMTLDKSGIPVRSSMDFLDLRHLSQQPYHCELNHCSTETSKLSKGSFPLLPSNITIPEGGWSADKDFSINCFTEAGYLGSVFSGFSSILDNKTFTSFLFRNQASQDQILEFSICHEGLQAEEASILRVPVAWESTDISSGYKFCNVPQNLSVDTNDLLIPVFSWNPIAGQLNVLKIYNTKYDFNWTVLSPTDEYPDRLPLIFLPSGTIGMPLEGQQYKACLETWTIPDFDYDNFHFHEISNKFTHMGRSKSIDFTVRK